MAISTFSSTNVSQERVALNFGNFCQKFSLNPLSQELTTSDKVKAVALLVFLNLATCFLFSMITCLKREKKVQSSLTTPILSHREEVVSSLPVAASSGDAPLSPHFAGAGGPLSAPKPRVTSLFSEQKFKDFDTTIHRLVRDRNFNTQVVDLNTQVVDLFKQAVQVLRNQLDQGSIDEAQYIKELACYFMIAAFPPPAGKYMRVYPPIHSCDGIDFRQGIRKIRGIAETCNTTMTLRPEDPDLVICRIWQDQGSKDPSARELAQDLISRSAIRRPSFSDDDIMGVLPNNPAKHLILQPGQRCCVPAAAAMIVSDRRGKPIEVPFIDLGDDCDIIRLIEQNGLTAIQAEVRSWEELSRSLKANGPACMSCRSIGGHQIVVDEVVFDREGKPEAVHIRDPYHGWAIAVKPESFVRNLGGPINQRGFVDEIKLIHAC